MTSLEYSFLNPPKSKTYFRRVVNYFLFLLGFLFAKKTELTHDLAPSTEGISQSIVNFLTFNEIMSHFFIVFPLDILKPCALHTNENYVLISVKLSGLSVNYSVFMAPKSDPTNRTRLVLGYRQPVMIM